MEMTPSEIRAIVESIVSEKLGFAFAMRAEQRGAGMAAVANLGVVPAEHGGTPQDWSMYAAEAGMRDSDSFGWRHTGDGEVSISNVVVAYDGIAQTFGDGSVTINDTDKYVYALVTWQYDETETTKVIGIDSVTIDVATSFADAAKKEDDDSGVRIPLYKFKKLDATPPNVDATIDEVVCEIDYIHGTAHALSIDADKWQVDTDVTSYEHSSISKIENPDDPTQPKIVTLFEFKTPTAFTMRYNGHASWSADADKQKVLTRYEKEDGSVVLRYADHNPLPLGTATNAAIVWDETGAGFIATKPTDSNDDATYPTETLTTGDRVVISLKKGSGGLVQAVTKKLGTMGGGIPTGYSERTSTIIDAQVTQVSGVDTVQIKRGTVLVKDADTSWTDLVSPTAFDD